MRPVTKVLLGLLAPVALALAGAPNTGLACGDKFLVCGTGVDVNRTDGKSRPASIVIYRNPEAHENEGVADPDLEKKLSAAGHNVRTVRDLKALEDELTSGRCEVLLAELAVARELHSMVESAPHAVQVVPVMYKPKRSEYRNVTEEFACVLRTPGRGNHIISVIDEAIRRLG